MDKFARNLITLIILTGLVACGGGGGSSSSDSETGAVDNSVSENNQLHPTVTDDFVAVKVSGSAVKGVISNGIVTLYSIDDQGAQAGVLGSGVTDQLGAFNVDIPQSYSGLVEVVVAATGDSASPTLMVCDASAGCGFFNLSTQLDSNQNGVIDFGEQFALNSSFEISHIVAYSEGEPFSVHVTPLTHLTSRFAKSLEGGATVENFNLARSQVANLFDLVSAFDELEAVDITQLEDLDGVDGDVLNYSLISASFAGLASEGGDLGEIIEQLTVDFVNNRGQLILVGSSDSEVSLSRIFQNAIDLTNQLGAASDVLDPLRNMLTQQVTQTLTAEVGELSESLYSATVNADQLTKVQHFTETLQSWSGVIDLNESNALAFSDQFSAVQGAFESTRMLAALAAVGKYAAVFSVVPDVANNEAVLPFLCGYVDGVLGTLCSGLAEQYTLGELCSEELTLLGLDACDLVSQYITVSVPTLEPDLKVSFNVLSRELTATGEVFDQQVDMLFTVPDLYSEEVIFTNVSGSFVNEEASLQLDGVLSLEKQEGLKLSDFSEDLNGSGVTGQLSVVLENGSGGLGSLSLSLGVNTSFALSFESESSDGEQALVTLLGEVDGLSLSQSRFVVTYADRMFELASDAPELLVLRNQDGVEMEFYLGLEGDGQLGAVFLDAELFGTIWREGALVRLDYVNGEEADLTALF